MASTEDFIAHVKRYGLARSNKFRVTIEGLVPAKLDPLYVTDSDKIDMVKRFQMSTDVIELPPVTLQVTESRFRKMPHTQQYDNLNIQFKLSADGMEKRVMDAWMSKVVNKYTDYVSYQNEYTCNIKIELLSPYTTQGGRNVFGQQIYDEEETVIHTVILYDAYPIIAAPIELNQSEQNSYMRVSVTFAYRFWDVVTDGVSAVEQIDVGFPSPDFQNNDETDIIGRIRRNAEYEANKVKEKSFGDRIRQFKTGIEGIMETTKGLMNLNQGEALNLYTKLNDIVTKNFGLSINETDRFVKQFEQDIDSIQDTNILSSPNKVALLGAAALLRGLWN